MRSTPCSSWFGLLLLAGAVGACREAPKTDDAPAASAQGAQGQGVAAPSRRVDPTVTATVSGAVLFGGQLPESTMIRASSDAACAKAHPGEFDAGDVRVQAGKVENAFVWVKAGLEDYAFDPPTGPVTLEQLGCMYKPRVVGVRTGQEIVFTNDDPTMHNVASKPAEQKGWNFVTMQGTSGRRSFAKPEVPIRVGCDVHPWMRAYLGVVAHPFFAVTGADGRFRLAGLPPGTYTLAAWHERLGTLEQRVTVAAREAKTVDFTLTGATP